MVARRFSVRHEDSTFDVDYDTDDGLEVFKFQLFSVTSIPPDEQKIVCGDDNKIVSDDSDLISISDKLCLMSINDQAINEAESSSGSSHVNEELIKSDEELARMLQAEEEALLLQQYVAEQDNGQMEQKIRPYVDQVLMYEDANYQEAARKTVPIAELEERALVALAKKVGSLSPLLDFHVLFL
ncbi:hypothetical protein Cgig2_000068 [Carnegiea gigantea]|uniref:Uncharacterized protein n=1 Tax=Carnegiea gigantea TaxID=171969 RepID=A0A9Q1KZD6_9CARY|nr:hypothetical protein Cgig2_000068 [Carnegiea gigantea]